MKNVIALLVAALIVVAGGASPRAAFAARSKSASSVPASQRLDLNTASLAELIALPGIGEAFAAKIVAGRPYARKSQLVTRKILTKDQYAKIRPLVVAHRIKK